MGQCCKCGKETANEFTYYAGDLIDQHSGNIGYNQIRTTATYANLQKRSAYLCAKCLHFKEVKKWGVYCLVALALCLLGFVNPGFLFFTVPGVLVCGISSLIGMRSITKDKIHVSKQTDATNMVLDVLKERCEDRKKSFLSPATYKALTPGKPHDNEIASWLQQMGLNPNDEFGSYLQQMKDSQPSTNIKEDHP